MNGYILVSRKIVESEIWRKPPLYLKVWIWLLCRAQFQNYNNLERGQVFTSVKEIQEACYHYSGYRKERPTEKQIRTILNWLRNPCGGVNGSNDGSPMVVTTGVTHGIVVTICNFNDYQDPNFYGGNNVRPAEGLTESSRKAQKGRTNNNTNKIHKNTNKEYSADEVFLFGEFKNVKLSGEELDKLKKRFPADWQDRIENLSQYMKSKGKQYKSHYATILSWARKDDKENTVQNTKSNIDESKNDLDDLF